MRLVILVAILGLATTGCTKTEGAAQPTTGAAPADEAPEDKAAKPGEAAAAPEAPTPVKPAAQAAQAAPAPASLDDSAANMKELEGKPGATPALKNTTVAASPKRETIPGMPGPSPGAGPGDALVQVYLFSDFQCPVCRRVVEPIKALHRAFPEKVQIVFKHNALEMHRFANAAATAAIAAFRQDKFWEYHDKLFENYRNLHEQDLLLYAEELGLDITKFQADMKDPKVQAQVNYERGLAAELGMRGTPGLYINGKKSIGWGSYRGVKVQVARAVQAASAIEGKTGHDVAIEATRNNGEDGKKFAQLVYGVK